MYRQTAYTGISLSFVYYFSKPSCPVLKAIKVIPGIYIYKDYKQWGKAMQPNSMTLE